MIENKNWKILSQPAKAVFPAIACFADKNGVAFPGEDTISAVTGITEKRVRQGIKDLDGFPGFEWDFYTTRRGRRSKKFKLSLPKNPKPGESFPFHKYILESGNWCQSKPSAKALYPVMRYFGFFDIETYLNLEDENDEYSLTDFQEVYPRRKWDNCQAEKMILADYAGIDRRSINTALDSLEKCGLIKPYEGEGWLVYLKSKDNLIFTRAFLNNQLMGKKYRS